MNGRVRSIEYIAKQINEATNTKQSIITAASSCKSIKNKIKQIEKQAWEEVLNKKPEKIDFNPAEIERIVLKSSDREER